MRADRGPGQLMAALSRRTPAMVIQRPTSRIGQLVAALSRTPTIRSSRSTRRPATTASLAGAKRPITPLYLWGSEVEQGDLDLPVPSPPGNRAGGQGRWLQASFVSMAFLLCVSLVSGYLLHYSKERAGIKGGPVVDILYTRSLARSSSGWATERTSTGDIGFRADGYHLQALGVDSYVTTPIPAPESANGSDITVTATASLSGQGMWGVSCRAAERGSQGYWFLLTHASAVGILAPGDTVPEWQSLTGIRPTQLNTISAHCADLNGGLELTMSVNGRVVTSRRPTEPLGPGYSGLVAGPFLDVQGPTADARFTKVSITTPHL